MLLGALPAGAASERDKIVLEGEDFDAADPSCDPDRDGERTAEASRYPERPERRVFLPHSGCGVTFHDVRFDRDPLIDAVRVGIGGADTTFRFRVDVYIDQEKIGDFLGHATPHDQMVTLSPSFAGWAPSGVHDVRVDYTITEGPTYGNLELDHVRFVLQDEATGHLVNATSEPDCPDLRVVQVLRGSHPVGDPVLLQVQGGDPGRDYGWQTADNVSYSGDHWFLATDEPGLHSVQVAYAAGDCAERWSRPYYIEVVDRPVRDLDGLPEDDLDDDLSLMELGVVILVAPLVAPMVLELAPLFILATLSAG